MAWRSISSMKNLQIHMYYTILEGVIFKTFFLCLLECGNKKWYVKHKIRNNLASHITINHRIVSILDRMWDGNLASYVLILYGVIVIPFPHPRKVCFSTWVHFPWEVYLRIFSKHSRSVAFLVCNLHLSIRNSKISVCYYANEEYMNENLKVLLARQPKYPMSNFTAFSLTFLLKNVIL